MLAVAENNLQNVAISSTTTPQTYFNDWFDNDDDFEQIVMQRVSKLKANWSEEEKLKRKFIGEARRERLMDQLQPAD